jgi:hypothetical protein
VDENGVDENGVGENGLDPVRLDQVIVAAQLHVTDVVRREGALRVVTSLRMQGAPPEVCVEFAGLVGRHHYPANARVSVRRPRQSSGEWKNQS